MTEFESWVTAVIRTRYDNVASRLAEKLGMSVSAFLRSSRKGTLSLENLLRLAEETGEPAGQVLRMGGKGALADLIERLFGESSTLKLSGDARILAEQFDALQDARMKRFYQRTLSGLAESEAPPAQTDAPVAAKTGLAPRRTRAKSRTLHRS